MEPGSRGENGVPFLCAGPSRGFPVAAGNCGPFLDQEAGVAVWGQVRWFLNLHGARPVLGGLHCALGAFSCSHRPKKAQALDTWLGARVG